MWLRIPDSETSSAQPGSEAAPCKFARANAEQVGKANHPARDLAGETPRVRVEEHEQVEKAEGRTTNGNGPAVNKEAAQAVTDFAAESSRRRFPQRAFPAW